MADDHRRLEGLIAAGNINVNPSASYRRRFWRRMISTSAVQ